MRLRGVSACELRLEKYIKIVRDSRQVRSVIYPALCVVTQEQKNSTLGPCSDLKKILTDVDDTNELWIFKD